MLGEMVAAPVLEHYLVLEVSLLAETVLTPLLFRWYLPLSSVCPAWALSVCVPVWISMSSLEAWHLEVLWAGVGREAEAHSTWADLSSC